jgi:ribulose-5-phosphate 4-epimerase/fuculose-1-phosphate aldolase
MRLDESRRLVADACRVLASRGLAEGVLGHISLRVEDDLALIRCRGPQERGLAWTTPDDIRLISIDGRAADRGELDGWTLPGELPMHAEILRRNAAVASVVHAHPPAVVAADLAGLRIRPIVGAFDAPGAKLTADGVPVYPSSELIGSQTIAAEMLSAMSDRPVVVMRGHGATSVGSSVQEAVLRMISVDRIARMSLMVVNAGGSLVDLTPAELAQLPDLGRAYIEGPAWRHEVARLQSCSDHSGRALR